MNTSSMYLNKFSSGTILALLALSGMLFLVPLAAPVHATNASPLTYTITSGSPVLGGTATEVDLTITNPATNQYAVTVVNILAPSGWTIDSTGGYGVTPPYLGYIAASANSIQFSSLEAGYYADQLPPGASAQVYFTVTSSTGIYPFSGTFTTTVQDASSASYYTGASFSLQVIDPSTTLTSTNVVVTPSGSNGYTQYTAGTSPYSVSATLQCNQSEVSGDCPTGYENGVTIVWSQTGYVAGTVYSFSPTSGYTSGNGEATTTFQPSDSTAIGELTATIIATVGTTAIHASPSTGAITTYAGAPTSVGFYIGTANTPFPSTEYLSTQGSTTHTPTFTGAELAQTGATQVYISAADKFGNPDSFGSSGQGVVINGHISVQTASGAVFDTTGLPTSLTLSNPGTGSSVELPYNYFQSGVYGTAGVLTATISGATYNGNALSVSGSSGTIQTSTFATSGSFTLTNHASLPNSSPTICSGISPPATCVTAGKSLTVDYVLGVAQSGVPITVAVCPTATCGTTKNYTGTVTTASLVTNSSGIASTKLAVDTTAGSVAYLNATVLSPQNGAPNTTFVTEATSGITTVSGVGAKFTVVVGVGGSLDPSPITVSTPGATVYVNVVTSDAYGNPVATAGAQQVQINLVANPNTITVTSAYIPTGCWETNGTLTSTNGCSGSFNSFGPIAWTLPSTVGSTATITASGVLGGVLVTSATTSVSIVSATPTLSVFSPKPLSNVIYSKSVNLQFRGWANASLGYNGQVSMTSLGWEVGAATWQSTTLSGTTAQWSVVATLPVGLNSIQFNATDSKANVVVSPTYSVLVDTEAPTITNVTPVGANLTNGQLFQANIVSDQGDLNASSVTVSYNGTTLASSAVQVSGTNNNGHSVTYSVTAALPTGHWNVQVSASSLAGLTGSSTSELVTVFVAPGNSVTFNTSGATYGTVGAYSGVTVSVTNAWSTSQTIVVFATIRSSTGLYVAQGTVTLAPGQTQSVFAADLLPVPAGTYTVTFSAVTTSNLPVSAPTVPITVTVA